MEKEKRIDYLRRQRLFEGEKENLKVTRRAVERLDDETRDHPKFKLFQKRTHKTDPSDRSYPLSANELPVESKKKIRKKIRLSWRFFSAILTLVFSACLLAAWRLAEFKVNLVEITGVERISAEEVNAVFNVSEQPIFMVIPEDITGKISHSFPELKNITTTASIPDKITINVTERIPILSWNLGNAMLWVDGEGIIIPARGKFNGLFSIESSSFPVFSYPKPENESDPEMDKYQEKHDYWKNPRFSMTWFEYHRHIDPGLLNAIIRLKSQIPSQSTFIYDPHRGLGWNDTHGWKIFVGLDLENINEKMLAYERIVSELTSQGIHPSLVSVEYLHAPYYRMD